MGAPWFTAAPASLAPDQLYRCSEAGSIGQAVLAPAMVGVRTPQARQAATTGRSVWTVRRSSPRGILSVGVEAVEGKHMQSLQPEEFVAEGAQPGAAGKAGWAAEGVQVAAVRHSAGERSCERSPEGRAVAPTSLVDEP